MMNKDWVKTLKSALLRLLKLSSFAALLCVLSASLEQSRIPTTLERIQTEGSITMYSRNGPTTFYEGADGLTGFEYKLAKSFAKHLGVKLKLIDEANLGALLNSLRPEMPAFAAAGLTVTPQRTKQVDFAPSYLETTQTLIYKSGTGRPKTIDDLIGKRLMVMRNSSHEENLRQLRKQHPQLTWEAVPKLDSSDLLEKVHNGEIDYTIIDSHEYDFNKIRFPRARAAFDVSESQQLAWAFPQQKDKSLLREAEKFFAKEKTQKLIARNMDIYFGHVDELNVGDSLLFARRLEHRLPKWKDKLVVAAQQNELDWQLLAALSYQESHWNPRAVSRTGVKGFMMLTRAAAKEVGVKNRYNADKSISGGAKYFKKIYDRIPERIENPDRTWLALAAYNVGMGHLEDARKLTEHYNGNPDRWVDVKEHLLLLSKREHYTGTRHGYARGWEAVDYVQNIRNFYNIISWHQRENEIERNIANASGVSYAEFNPILTEAVRDLSGVSAEL